MMLFSEKHCLLDLPEGTYPKKTEDIVINTLIQRTYFVKFNVWRVAIVDEGLRQLNYKTSAQLAYINFPKSEFLLLTCIFNS